MKSPRIVIEIHDIEVAEVMSELNSDYWPGVRLVEESVRNVTDEEISYAVDVLTPEFA